MGAEITGRLTGWDDDFPYLLKCYEGGGCQYMGSKDCEFCDHNIAVYRKLAAYEDSGLTPERCAELAKAELEG